VFLINNYERWVDMQKFKSGQKAPQRGQYKIVSTRGKVVRSDVALAKWDSFPPTPSANQHFEKQQ
jgi:YjzC-like protein